MKVVRGKDGKRIGWRRMICWKRKSDRKRICGSSFSEVMALNLGLFSPKGEGVNQAGEVLGGEVVKVSEIPQAPLMGEDITGMRVEEGWGVIRWTEVSSQGKQDRNLKLLYGSLLMIKGIMKAKGDLLKVNQLRLNVSDVWALGIISLSVTIYQFATSARKKDIWQLNAILWEGRNFSYLGLEIKGKVSMLWNCQKIKLKMLRQWG
jgi:hypothetical protein